MGILNSIGDVLSRREIKMILAGLSLLFFWVGCSKQESINLPSHVKDLENLKVYSSDVDLAYQINLAREQTFGDTVDVFVRRFSAVAVDEEGRVYIADGSQLDIKVYEADGSFLIRLGREGQEPGEFRNFTNLQVADNRIFVHDNTLQRSVIFSLDSLEYDYTVNIADNRGEYDELSDAYPGRYYVRSDGSFLMTFSKSNFSEDMSDWDSIDNRSLYYRMDQNGQIVSEKLFDMRSVTHVLVPVGALTVGRSVGFHGRLLTALSDDDHIYLVRSDDFLIKEYSLDGEYQRAFYYPYERVPLTQTSATDAGIAEFILEGFQSMDVPETWPALNALLVDDENRVWISAIVENNEIYEWWVLQDTGELITKFEWPRDEPIEVVRNGYMYTRETEEETGLDQIVRYRIEMDEI